MSINNLELRQKYVDSSEKRNVRLLFEDGTYIPELTTSDQQKVRQEVAKCEARLNQRFGQSISPSRMDKASELLLVSSISFATMLARQRGLPTLPDYPSASLLRDIMQGLGFSQGNGWRTVVHTTVYEGEPRQMTLHEAGEVGIHEVIHSKAEPVIIEQSGGTIIKRKGGKWEQIYDGKVQDTQQRIIDEAETDILSLWAKNPEISTWGELEKRSMSWKTTTGYETSRLGLRLVSLLSQAAYRDFNTGLHELGTAYFSSSDYITAALEELGDSQNAKIIKDQMRVLMISDNKEDASRTIAALENFLRD
jgi:hypothetical protein